ncbi:MAG: GIY-YIG nuclease family protein [Cyclobacteriaceae bacterium]|nr:GIY-YIG nuclease family protein [Cyclobacteriaceae bacterium]
MWFVYIIKSIHHPFIYVGMTRNVDKRLESHNRGLNQSTQHNAPYDLVFFLAVKTAEKARELEKYFKRGSGKAFIKRHFPETEHGKPPR